MKNWGKKFTHEIKEKFKQDLPSFNFSDEEKARLAKMKVKPWGKRKRKR